MLQDIRYALRGPWHERFRRVAILLGFALASASWMVPPQLPVSEPDGSASSATNVLREPAGLATGDARSGCQHVVHGPRVAGPQLVLADGGARSIRATARRDLSDARRESDPRSWVYPAGRSSGGGGVVLLNHDVGRLPPERSEHPGLRKQLNGKPHVVGDGRGSRSPASPALVPLTPLVENDRERRAKPVRVEAWPGVTVERAQQI